MISEEPKLNAKFTCAMIMTYKVEFLGKSWIFPLGIYIVGRKGGRTIIWKQHHKKIKPRKQDKGKHQWSEEVKNFGCFTLYKLHSKKSVLFTLKGMK